MAVEIRAATYASLRTALAAGTYQAGQMVFVEGRSAAGDGGQGMGQVVAIGSLTDDGGVTLTGGSLAWVRDGLVTTPEMFGAVGGDSAADTAAFEAFRGYALTRPAGTVVTLNCFAGRTYHIANPWWPLDIPILVVNGNGCKMKNTASDNRDKSLLNPTTAGNKNTQAAWFEAVDAYLIETTTVGDTSITCLTASDAGEFSAGETVMIASADKQFGGQPANYGNFEFRVVESVDAVTGQIDLAEALNKIHRADMPYLTGQTPGGRASIHKIEQTALWAIDHEYREIEFVRNDVSSSGATTEAVYVTGGDIRFVRCVAPYFLVTVARNVVIDKCHQTGASEFDKLVHRVVCTDSVFDGEITSATGVEHVLFDRCRLNGAYELGPENLVMRDTRVVAANQSALGIKPSYSWPKKVEIDGGQHDFYPRYTTTTTQTISVVVNDAAVAWDEDAGELTLSLAATSEKNFAGVCYPGRVLHLTANSNGAELLTGVHGVINSVRGSENEAIIGIDFNGSISLNDKITAFPEPHRVSINGRSTNLALFSQKIEKRRLLVTSGLLNNHKLAQSAGRLVKCVIEVVRPYTGATAGNVKFEFYTYYPDYYKIRKIVDLRTTGRRECDLVGHVGWTGTGGESSGAVLPSGDYISDFPGTIEMAGSTMAAANDGELAIINIELTFDNLFMPGW